MEPERRRFRFFRKILPFLRWMPGILYLEGPDREPVHANDHFRQAFGDRPHDAFDRIFLGTASSFAEWIAQQEPGTGAARGWEGRLPDGKTYRIYASPFIEDDGTPMVLVLGADVTDQRNAARAVERTYEMLARRIEERTQELDVANAALREEVEGRKRLEEELRRSQEELEERVRERTKELSRVNRELRETAETLERMFDASPLPLFMLDAEGRILRWNPAAERLFGYRAEEVLGRFIPIVPEEEKELLFSVLRRASRGETFQSIEVRRRRKDGSFVTCLLSTAPLLDERGTFRANLGYLVDITERRRNEEELDRHRKHLEELVAERTAEMCESEARFRTSVETMLDGFVILSPIRDEEGRIIDFRNVYINDAGCRLTGVPREDYMGRTHRELFPEIVSTGLLSAYVRVLETGEPYSADALAYEGSFGERRASGFFDIRAFRAGDNVSIIYRDVTERKKLQDAVLEEQARLRAVVETMPVGVWVEDQDGRILLANEAAHRIWGGARYVGIESFGDYKGWRPDTGRRIEPQEWAGARAILKGETAFEEEVDIEGFDGVRRTILNSATPVRDASGKITGGVVVNQDITEKRKADRALRESEATLRSIFENSLDGILLTVPDGATLAANPAACRMLGRSEEEIRRAGRSGIVDESDPRVGAILEERARTGSARGELEYRRPDGSVFPVWVVTSLFRDSRGNLRTTLSFRDITEQKKAEAALRASEERYRRIVETASEGIWMGDAEGRTVFANPVLAQMLGYTVDEMKELVAIDFVHEEDRPGWLLLRERNRRGERQQVEHRLRRKDGGDLWALVSTNPLLDDEGRYTGGLVMVTDLTEHRRLEEQDRHYQRLEAVGRLAGGVAHEFNNMMTVVTGYAELLLSRMAPGAPGRREMEQIRQSGDRAARLTRRLLAFGRRQTMQPRPVDLNETVKQMDRVLGGLPGTSIRTHVHPAPGLWKANVDPGQVEQAILSLVVNARDAMPQGGTLVLETANVVLDADASAGYPPELSPGRYVVLTVSDTGSGMDPATREHLFEPFFDDMEAGMGQEAGLGLAAAYGIVRQSGGHIAVHSAPGKGTSFRVFLPCAPEPSATAEEPAEPAKAAGRGETVLVVEDDEGVRELVRNILEGKGYRVLAAGTGEEALPLCEGSDRPVALLLADVAAPGTNVREMAERIAARYPALRTLWLSGYSEEPEGPPETSGTAAAVLRKPFSPGELARKVRSLLEG